SPHGGRHSGQNCTERIGRKFCCGGGGRLCAGKHGEAIASLTVATGLWPVCLSTVSRERDGPQGRGYSGCNFTQLRFKLRASLSTKFASRRRRLRTNRHAPASTK